MPRLVGSYTQSTIGTLSATGSSSTPERSGGVGSQRTWHWSQILALGCLIAATVDRGAKGDSASD